MHTLLIQLEKYIVHGDRRRPFPLYKYTCEWHKPGSEQHKRSIAQMESIFLSNKKNVSLYWHKTKEKKNQV